MVRYILFADQVSAWFAKAFAWLIIVMIVGMCYEVFMRYFLTAPTTWAFDISYIMYGTLFMIGGAYTLSRGGHVRGDFIYRLWKPQTQAKVELVLYFLFFFPGVLALVFSGWRYAGRSIRYGEVSSMSPAGVPIFEFKAIIVAAGVLLVIQGIAQVCRCLLCIRTGEWMEASDTIEEIEAMGLKGNVEGVLQHSTEAVDVPYSNIDNHDNTKQG